MSEHLDPGAEGMTDDSRIVTRSTDGMAQLIDTILRKYGGTMKGRGDHDIYDALVRYRAAIRAQSSGLDVDRLARTLQTPSVRDIAIHYEPERAAEAIAAEYARLEADR